MIRAFASFLLSALLLAAAPAMGAPAPRPSATVDGTVVRLGDLFSDAGPNAGDVVAAAPAPGMHMICNADWLAAVAREHHLDWQPGSAYDQVTIERASRVIGEDAVTRRLIAAIAARQPIENARLQLDNPGLSLIVPANAPDAIAVDGLTIDQRSFRVSAYVSAPAGDPAAARLHVTGRLVYRVELPVPGHALAPGETIAAGDLETIAVQRDRIGPDIATDPAQLIGKTPRRALSPDEPVRLADVQVPILVHKGDLVTIVLNSEHMQLATQGTALEDGADSAAIRVQNNTSHRVIDATVAGPGTVQVTPASATAASLAAQTALR